MPETFLLDTTILIDSLRVRNRRRELLVELVSSGNLLATSAMNVGEVYAGMRPQEARTTDDFIASLTCLPITAAIAALGGSLKSFWAGKGVTLGVQNMIIAATALEHDLVLMTDNLKDFARLDVKLFQFPTQL